MAARLLCQGLYLRPQYWAPSGLSADLLRLMCYVKWSVLNPYVNFFGIPNFGIGIPICNFSTAEFKKKIRPESPESKTESEFRFQWRSQKLEPKIGIPNQACRHPCKLTPQKTPCHQRLLSISAHTWSVASHVAWHYILLVVDNFGIKTTSVANLKHLVSSLQEHYYIVVDWTGSLFWGVKLRWDYINWTVNLHMPNYINKALLKYQHPALAKPQHAPYRATPLQFGARVQTVMTDTTAPLSKEQIKCMQDIVGTLLYYGLAVDPIILPAISTIAFQQAQGTETMADTCHQLLDYVATHPNAGICCLASDMILAVHTDAWYLSEHNVCSQASAHFYLAKKGDKEFNNSAILNLASIIKHVMSLASDSKLVALYYGCKIAIPIQTTLDKMGHTQPPTPITTDNIMAQGLTIGTMTPKASKSMDEQFHWFKCHSAQHQLLYLWHCSIIDCADYTSKYHAPKHHQAVWPFFIFDLLPTQWLFPWLINLR